MPARARPVPSAPAATLVLLAVLAALLLPAAPPAAAVRLAPHTFAGTLLGTDGRAVDAILGFDLHDGAGRQIDAKGCVRSPQCPLPGYGLSLRVNPDLSAEGSRDTRRWATRWSVQVPPNTASVYVEAYPQGPSRRTDESRYGSTMRHQVPVPTTRPVALRLPMDRCAQGGTTGGIAGVATRGGRPVHLTRAVAWSLAADNDEGRPVLGWNVELPGPHGTYRLPNLASGQPYQVWLTDSTGAVRRTRGVVVRPCSTTRLDVRF